MDWQIELAKNGQYTIKLNGVYLYSKYNPKNDVERFMRNEVDFSKKNFIVVGLGLGYHIEFLLDNIEGVHIQYILLDSKEEQFYKKYSFQNCLAYSNVSKFKENKIFASEAQLIVPQSFVNALNPTHPLFAFIEDIKIRQISFKSFKDQMEENFFENIKLFKPLVKENLRKRKAALIASGPSLNATIEWLKRHEEEFDIFCVGSALKVALSYEIFPKKTFIIDAQDNIVSQTNIEYSGDLVFLSTANYKAVSIYKGAKQIIFQKGYPLAEQFATQYQQPLFETGGSVATTVFSYIEWLEYEELYLFGQDLGFAGTQTHAEHSTSGRTVTNQMNILEVEANDGTIIKTTPNLLAYKRWFDNACSKTTLHVINTAKKGAKISNTFFLDVLYKSL